MPKSQSAPVQMHAIVYNALDIVEERTKLGGGYREAGGGTGAGAGAGAGGGGREEDGYVGCLTVLANNALYGSVTTGGYKLFLGIQGSDANIDRLGGPMRTAFRRIGDALIAAVLNPMYEMETPLRGDKFAQAVAHVVRWYS